MSPTIRPVCWGASASRYSSLGTYTHKAQGLPETRQSAFARSLTPHSVLTMWRKGRHDPVDEKGQSSSPLKRRKNHTCVSATAVANRHAEKPKDNPLTGLWCVICASTSIEGLLPVDEQPENPVPRCHQNGGTWMAHRTCGQLLNGTCVFKPSNSEGEVVEGLRSIDRGRFKLVSTPLPS